MRIPFINSNQTLQTAVDTVVAQYKTATANGGEYPQEMHKISTVQVTSAKEAIDYVNYQMPPLIMVNLSDPEIDTVHMISHIAEDPWLNHGSIIAVYQKMSNLEALEELEQSNIIIHLSEDQLPRLLPSVFSIVRDNWQILFQRIFQSELVANLSGRFILDMELPLIPCYSNLLANYLFNMGFMPAESKATIALVFTELLTNAIEHGNCGINAKEKLAHLESGGTMYDLIAERAREPDRAHRKVVFEYDINRDGSRYVIRDEGEGFDWQHYLHPDFEADFLAPHGRGIFLARESVQGISYNDKGNEVRLELAHQQNPAGHIPGAFLQNESLDCQPGDVIFREGEESDFLYYIAEGEFLVSVEGRAVNKVTPSDMLMGELSFLLEESRSATVIADTPGRLIKISKEAFVNIIKEHPYYGIFLSKLIARRLVRQDHSR